MTFGSQLDVDAAKELLLACSARCWRELLGRVAASAAPLRRSTRALASLDALLSLAKVSGMPGYVRPRLLDDSEPAALRIEAGRHPILEALMTEVRPSRCKGSPPSCYESMLASASGARIHRCRLVPPHRAWSRTISSCRMPAPEPSWSPAPTWVGRVC